MTTITINDQTLNVAPGATVLDAARQNNIYLPTLCQHPQLKPVGACRLCIVEIEGLRGQPTACTTPVVEGMVVQTETPAVQELRREILSLILSEHPHTCLVCERHARCAEWQGTIRKAAVTTGCENCPKNGQCELQTLIEKITLCEVPYPITYRGLPVEKSDPFFDHDFNLCVMCGRCVRACQDVRRTGTLAFLYRGKEARVGTAFGHSYLEADCEFCGACVDVCPVGALYDKRTKWEGAPASTGTTVCPYCSVGCQLDLWVKNGKVMGVRPTPEGAANKGQACVRGRFGVVDMIHATDRLRHPLVRKDGRLTEVTWDEALQTVAAKFTEHKGEAFALLASPHLTNESLYTLQKFARQVMQSRNIDCAAALPRHARANELRNRLLNTQPAEIQKIETAGCILVIGANPRLSHPVVALKIRQALAAGAKLIVIDPRETELARRAHVWLMPAPGTDGELIEELTQKSQVPNLKSQSSVDRLTRAAQLLQDHGPAVIIYGSGVTHYASGPDTIEAIEELAGTVTPAAMVLPLLGAANTLGALQTGAVAGAGDCNYTEIVSGIAAGQIKALYLAGEAPPLEVLDQLDFLVVQDIVPSSNLKNYADVVFPAASFAEIDGTMINLEGRTQSLTAAIAPLGQARPDWQIVTQLAQALGAIEFQYQSASDVLEEIKSKAQDSRLKAQAASLQSPVDQLPIDQLLLIVERNGFSYRGGALTERVKDMARVKADEGRVTIHPHDAERLGIADGDQIRVSSAYGADTAPARVSAEVQPGTAFASFNDLTGSAIFPAHLPEVKAYAVRIEKNE